MESIKCQECGLVNWEEAGKISCKRCGAPLWQREESRLGYLSAQAQAVEDDGTILSGPIKILLGILGLAVVALLVNRVFHVMDKESAAMIAVAFFFLGLGLLLVAHLWLLIRIFEQSVGWGLGFLFFPIVGLIAVVMFWDYVKRAFVAQFISIAIMLIGLLSGTK